MTWVVLTVLGAFVLAMLLAYLRWQGEFDRNAPQRKAMVLDIIHGIRNRSEEQKCSG